MARLSPNFFVFQIKFLLCVFEFAFEVDIGPSAPSPGVVDMFLPRNVAISARLVSRSPTDECAQTVRTNGGCCPPGLVMSSQGRSASSSGGLAPENENGMSGAPTEEEPILDPDNESEEVEMKREGDGDQQKPTEQQDEDGVEKNINSEVARTAPVSDSIPIKRGRDEDGMNGGPTEEEPIKPISKKRKEAENARAQPGTGRQKQQQQREQQRRQQEGGKEPKEDPVFPYGNYHRYYGYRLGRTMDEDPRLKCFQRGWFEGKDCLDIGCNEGFITISIAQKYECRSILGVDIDYILIKKATRNLTKADKASDSLKDGPPPEEGSLGETVVVRTCENAAENCGVRAGNQSALDLSDGRSRFDSGSLLEKVKFRQEQFIEDFPDGDYMKDGMFDTVLCLSVTKWIHLNWGDTGLIRLFAKIFHILRPGGVLILEPQPWKSYKKKCYVSEVTRRCYENIHLRPTHFGDVLLDKVCRMIGLREQAFPARILDRELRSKALAREKLWIESLASTRLLDSSQSKKLAKQYPTAAWDLSALSFYASSKIGPGIRHGTQRGRSRYTTSQA